MTRKTQVYNGLQIAMPIIVEARSPRSDEGGALKFEVELPQEFFGLEAEKQLGIIDGVANYVDLGIGRDLPRTDEAVKDAVHELSRLNKFSIPFSVRLAMRPNPELEVTAQFPQAWVDCSVAAKNYMLVFCKRYLESIGVMILSREARYGAPHEGTLH